VHRFAQKLHDPDLPFVWQMLQNVRGGQDAADAADAY
jgi:hypothetical protein